MNFFWGQWHSRSPYLARRAACLAKYADTSCLHFFARVISEHFQCNLRLPLAKRSLAPSICMSTHTARRFVPTEIHQFFHLLCITYSGVMRIPHIPTTSSICPPCLCSYLDFDNQALLESCSESHDHAAFAIWIPRTCLNWVSELICWDPNLPNTR